MEQPFKVTKLTGPSAEEWQLHQSTIKRLYLDENKTLPDVMRILRQQYGFKASTKMYKSHLTLWKMDSKNLRRSDIKQIAHAKIARDAAGKRSSFRIKTRKVSEESVLRYVKKHGFSNLADFVRIASPFAHNEGIECYTPVHSPSSTQVVRDLSGDLGSCPVVTTRNISTTPVLFRHHALSLSPTARSWALQALTPVPRSPLAPTAWRAPEEVFWTARSYLQGSFDATWFIDSEGWLRSLKTPNAWRPNQTLSNCTTASELISQGKHGQARQLLSEVCASIEQQIRFDDPTLLISLLSMLANVQSNVLRHVSTHVRAVILRHCALSTRYLLGARSPLTQFSSLLLNMDEAGSEIYTQLMKCEIGVLADRIGVLHPATIHRRASLIDCVVPSEAVIQAQSLYTACREELAQDHHKTVDVTLTLAEALHRNHQGREAQAVLSELLKDCETAPPNAYIHSMKAVTMYLLSTVFLRMNDLVQAARYSGLCINVMRPGPWDEPNVKLFLNHHATVLRTVGRVQEAEETQMKIEKLLGPPDIPELY